MRRGLLELLKVLLIEFIIIYLAYMFFKFSFSFLLELIAYVVCFTALPYILRKPEIPFKSKVGIGLVVLLISLACIICADGIGRQLFYFLAVVGVLTLVSCLLCHIKLKG